MNMSRSTMMSIASALALVLSGTASMAMAQSAPLPPPRPTMTEPPPPPPNSPPQTPGQFYQGTESTATYPLPDSNGGTLTVHAGMPDQVQDFGPPPAFTALDANHDGRISDSEARAYPPLDSDFLYASGGGTSISRAQYERWVTSQH